MRRRSSLARFVISTNATRSIRKSKSRVRQTKGILARRVTIAGLKEAIQIVTMMTLWLLGLGVSHRQTVVSSRGFAALRWWVSRLSSDQGVRFGACRRTHFILLPT